MDRKDIFAVILAGGAGTRFWPLSREQWPKQFLKIGGGKNLIARTVDRARQLTGAGEVIVVAGRELSEKIRLQLFGEDLTFVVEPEAKNTAPAIALAARFIHEQNREGIMVVLPSDHIIKHEDRFREAIERAVAAAREGYLVTLGILPGKPETGYGYIKMGRDLSAGVHAVSRFTEKPDREEAERFLQEGGYYWNSGMFIWRADTFLKEVKTHLPRLFEVISAHAPDTEGLEKGFKKVEPISVDYGVMEKSERVAVVPCDISWSDVGSWSALDEVEERDERGNVSFGNVLAVDCRDSIFHAGDELVAAVGLHDMVVVDTEDATLVIPKDRAQDVRKIVDLLKERGGREFVEHRTVQKPWGSFTVLHESEGYKVKKIEVLPGKRLSLQMHHERSEHWVVVSGTAKVTRGEEEYIVRANESTYIPNETKHRLENTGTSPLSIIEVQHGRYLGEDDIVRFTDDYGRG
jgi:mannose-1-phosphate guanylyltransferase/mannose-6-phosphate isomerase